MDQQVKALIRVLGNEAELAPEELATRLDVSTRTVRTYVRRANDALAPVASIIRSRGAGYRLVIADQKAFDALCASEVGATARHLPSTHDERVVYLLTDLLSRGDWVTLDDLAEVLFTSRRTISDDLKKVEDELRRFGLVIERRPRYGMRVAGSELSRRLCLASVAATGATGSSDAVSDADVAVIARCVEEATEELGFAVNAVAWQNLIIHIAIAIVRIRANAYVPMEAMQLQTLRDASVYPVAKHIATSIERAFGVALPEEEVAYIALHLSGKQSLGAREAAGLVISDEVWSVVGEMLEVVWSSFHFDLRADLELRMNLACHIVPLGVRLTYHMRLANPLTDDIRDRFPLAWSMAIEAASVLACRYGNMPDDDEIGYIALSFALALERQKAERPRKRILIVCASGAGSARLLEYQYRQEFEAYLDAVETCDLAHLDAVDLSQIDYVFTTVPLPHALPVPVREVHFFLDAQEIGDIRRSLADAPATTGAASFFSADLFFPHLTVATREEAIDVLCARIRERRSIPDDFEALVLKREQLAPSAFGGLMAMPHPVRPVTEHSFVTVGLLDEPIDWQGQPVRIVFLVSISTHKGRDLDGLYRSLVRFMNDGRLGERLLEDQTFSTLETILSEVD